jgi:ribose transport system substrate-binding protein
MGKRKLWWVAAVAVIALVAAGCGDDDDDSGGSTSGGGESVDDIKDHVNDLEGDVAFPDLPDGPDAAADKKIFVISVDQQLEGIVRQVNGVEEAGDMVGWDVTVIDGKSTPDAWSTGIERAVNEKADGIILAAFDVSFVKAAADKARAANIPMVAITSGSEVGPNGVFAEIGSVEYNTEMGRNQGRFVVADSDGSAKAIVFNDTSFATAPPIADGAIEILQGCSGCEMVQKIDFVGADITTKMSEAVRTALTRNPDANYVVVPYDFAALFAAQGIRDAGAAGRVKLVSTGGNLANLDLIREGDVQVMASAQPLEYFGYLAVDALNRALAGDDPIEFDAPQKILVEDNLPSEGQPWTGDEDFTDDFKQLWGI